MYTLSVYIAGEIDLFESLDIVHITLLVVVHVSPRLLADGVPGRGRGLPRHTAPYPLHGKVPYKG